MNSALKYVLAVINFKSIMSTHPFANGDANNCLWNHLIWVIYHVQFHTSLYRIFHRINQVPIETFVLYNYFCMYRRTNARKMSKTDLERTMGPLNIVEGI